MNGEGLETAGWVSGTSDMPNRSMTGCGRSGGANFGGISSRRGDSSPNSRSGAWLRMGVVPAPFIICSRGLVGEGLIDLAAAECFGIFTSRVEEAVVVVVVERVEVTSEAAVTVVGASGTGVMAAGEEGGGAREEKSQHAHMLVVIHAFIKIRNHLARVFLLHVVSNSAEQENCNQFCVKLS